MLRAIRQFTRLAAGFAVLGCAALAAPSYAYGPNLVARITEPFLVGDRLVPPGVLSLRPISDFHPGGTIDELWVGGDFLGLFVADGAGNETRADHDAVVFERDTEGHLVLIGYIVRGGRLDTAYRYRLGSTLAVEAPPAAAQPSGVFAAR